MDVKEKTMGSVEKILILPGWTISPQKWSSFVDKISSKDFSVEILKTPGLMTKVEKPWDLQDYVYWLGKKLDSQEGKVILIGHSNGGRIASAYVAQNSKKVSALVLIDSAGIYHKDLKIRIKRALFKTFAKAGKKLTSSSSARKLIYKLAREKDYFEADPILRETMKNLISEDLGPVFSKIPVQTLIIWGQNDRVTPLSDGRAIEGKIKNSKLVIIKGAKHSPQFTDGIEVVKIIKDFLKNT